MAFEPRNSIAGIMTAYGQSWKSPLSGMDDAIYKNRENKRQNELAKQKQAEAEAARVERERKAREREFGRKQAAEIFGMDENLLPPMDIDTIKDIQDIKNTQDEMTQKKVAEKLDRFSSVLGTYMGQDKKGKDWAKAREKILRQFPELGKDLPEQYDPFELTSIAAQTKAGVDILKSNRDYSRDVLESDRDYAMDKRKQGETERHNRESEVTARTKDSGNRGVKPTDERYIASRVAGLFDGIYDVQTGTLQIKDDASRKKAQKIIDDAARLAKNNPSMTLSRAVSEAAQRNGIVLDPSQPNSQQTQGNVDDPLGWR